MKKCEHCNSCFTTRWLYGNMYKICTLCKKAYTVEGNQFLEVTDQVTLQKLFALIGSQI